jgi:hypothetical protein
LSDVKGFRRRFSKTPDFRYFYPVLIPKALRKICNLTEYGIIEVTLRSWIA